MLNIEKVDHIGIRISDKARSVAFYQVLGFELITDSGFEKGHPIILEHPSGVVLNLLGPSNASEGENILMDVEEKHPGITHVSYKVKSLADTKAFLAKNNIAITGQINFKGLHGVFIRDPDRNVIELDTYSGAESGPRSKVSEEAIKGYKKHPD